VSRKRDNLIAVRRERLTRGQPYRSHGERPRYLAVSSQPNTGSAPMMLPPDVVTRPCACGASLTASRTSPFGVIDRHNRSVRHRRWWASVRDDWQGAA
jgi:hypothetical protein